MCLLLDASSTVERRSGGGGAWWDLIQVFPQCLGVGAKWIFIVASSKGSNILPEYFEGLQNVGNSKMFSNGIFFFFWITRL